MYKTILTLIAYAFVSQRLGLIDAFAIVIGLLAIVEIVTMPDAPDYTRPRTP